MRGKFIVLLFLLILSTSFAFAADSSILSNFDILGCKTGTESIPSGSCSRYGLYWCNDVGKLFDVFRTPGICRGKDLTNTDDDCCPPNYFCDTRGENPTNLCKLREYDCSNYTNKKSCEDQGCLWWDETLPEKCIDRRQLTSCSDYKRNSSCTRDLFGLGKTNGLGTEICRGMYSGTNLVMINSCRCKWNGTSETVGNCSLTYDITDELDQNKLFTCDKLFKLDNCTTGLQNVSWTVSQSSNGLILTSQDLIRFECINGSKLIRCDQELIKLPFFTLSNFLICSVIIFLVYFYMIKKRLPAGRQH